MKLFNRRAFITVDAAVRGNSAAAEAAGVVPALSIPCGKDGFDCRFEIRKDLTGKPNRARIEVYNLTQDHRESLSERAAKGPTRVRVDAGYGDDTYRIFAGDCRILYHVREHGCDFATVIESGDGDLSVSTARISKSWGPGTPVSTVIQDIAGSLEIGTGNLAAVVALTKLEGMGLTFVDGTAACGRAFKELDQITHSAGLEWSIQDGTLQFLLLGKSLEAQAVHVSPDTGMEEYPRIDHKQRLHVRTRMLPNIWPGRRIQLEGISADESPGASNVSTNSSLWRIDKARYHGETRGSSWSIFIEALKST